jgi:hypothetical protein
MVTALARIRDCYCALRAGKPPLGDEEIVILTKTAPKNADKAKSIV